MQVIFRPLRPGDWPGPLTDDSDRDVARFSATWTDTLELLGREVQHLQHSKWDDPEVILQVAADDRAMRLDGGLRADAKPAHPGVIVAFESRHGPLRYACDTFRTSMVWRSGRGQTTTPGWQANVRAVALGLEALRKVDRYGIARDGQQYTGFGALPPARPMGTGMTVDQAAAFIAEHAWPDECVDPQEVIDDLDAAYRAAAKLLHPDAGGDPDLFRRLTEARELVEAFG